MATSAPLPLAADVVFERMLLRLRLRHLRLVLALSASQNLRRAALEIGISQPAATQMLRETEDLLGLRLFERQALAHHARYALESLASAADSLAALASGTGGQLRVGGILAAINSLLAPVIAGFQQQHPGLRLEVVEDSSERLLAALGSAALQFILVRESTPVPAGFCFEPLLKDQAVVVAGLAHPAAQRTSVRLRDLADSAWIMPPRHFPIRQLFDALFTQARLQPRINEVLTTSSTLLPPLLASGTAVAPVPRSILPAEPHRQGLAVLKLPQKLALESLGVIYRPEGLTGAAGSLLQALRDGQAA